jgi:HK97 family phage portal protein
VVLNPDLVEIVPGPGGMPLYLLAGVEIPRAQLLHIKYQTYPGELHGVGPLEACWRNIVSADAMQEYGTQLAVNGGIPHAVLQSQVKLTKTQADDLKTSWYQAALTRGPLPVILSGGLTYTPLNLKPAEIGLLDMRRFDEQRIASCFGVPLWLVGLPMQDGLTYSTVEGTFDYLWRANLRAMAYNISSSLSGWALPRGQWLRFDSESLIRPPVLQRAQAYQILLSAGVISVDEARVFENLRPGGPQTTEILATTTEGGL